MQLPRRPKAVIFDMDGTLIDTILLMEQNSLYDHPDLYDLMGAHDPVIERFYVEMASERGGSVLDCCCGSGRLAIPLARAGLSVTGADLSAAMLARAGALARAEAVELDLIQLDMRNFDLERSFDTIILAANAILHLHSLADFEGFFVRRDGISPRRAGWCSTPSCRTSTC